MVLLQRDGKGEGFVGLFLGAVLEGGYCTRGQVNIVVGGGVGCSSPAQVEAGAAATTITRLFVRKKVEEA